MPGPEADLHSASAVHVGEPALRVAQDARRGEPGVVCGSAGGGQSSAAAVPVAAAAAAALDSAAHPGTTTRQPGFRGGRCVCLHPALNNMS